MGVAYLVAVWNPSPVTRFFGGIFQTLAWPFQRAFSFVAWKIGDTGEFLSSIGELKSRNEQLEMEAMRLRVENAKLSFLQEENESIRKAAGLKIRDRFDLLAGEVIGLGGEGERGTMLIDRGSVNGVRDGMTVIVGEGVLIGIVDEAFPLSSRVSLITNSKSAIGGVTVGNGTKGIVKGERGLGLLFDFAPQKDTLRSGDSMVTSGVGGNVPSGLLIGTVENPHESSDRLFQQASVISPIDMRDIRFVFLIRDDTGK
jgi:rod shape-determining protein MreC